MARASIVLGLTSLVLGVVLAPGGAAAQTQSDVEPYEGPMCFGTVISAVEGTDGRVLGSRDSGQAIFSEGDAVFIEGSGLRSGETYLMYRIEGDAEHPLDGETIGRIVVLLGRLTVSDVDGDRATGRIDSSCGEIETGDRLLRTVAGAIASAPAMPEFDPLRLISPDPADGSVVYGSSESLPAPDTESGRRAMTVRGSYVVGDIVTVDRGAAEGWGPGTVALFYETRSNVADDADAHGEPVLVGQGYVIWAEADTAALLITHSDRSIELGGRARRLR